MLNKSVVIIILIVFINTKILISSQTLLLSGSNNEERRQQQHHQQQQPNYYNVTEHFPLSIIHLNDFHATFEPIAKTSFYCNPEKRTDVCIGGYARVIKVVKQLLNVRPNPVYLNAGDNFRGSIWYDIGRWNVTSYFLNMLPADAMTLGNHDFTDGIDGIVPFLKSIKTPIVLCNVDDSKEPKFQGTYNKSIVIERSGRKIGIIGVIYSTVKDTSATENLQFFNESQSVATEAARLKQQGIDIIIVLSHCGIRIDKEIAQYCGSDNIDIIVGGHSHTIMYNGTAPGNLSSLYNITEVYPTTVNGVLIVQAWAYTKFVGDLIVWFNEYGKVQYYTGAPIFLDSNIEEDADVLDKEKPWKNTIDAIGNRIIGTSKITLKKTDCFLSECALGNLIADAFLNYYVINESIVTGDDEWDYDTIAIVNVNGIRRPLDAGVITYAKLKTILPHDNTLDSIELRGDHLWEVIEMRFGKLQVSGLKIAYNKTRPIGKRLQTVEILCNKCKKTPEYYPLNLKETYRLILPSIFVTGYAQLKAIKENYMNHRIGPLYYNVFEEYIHNNSPIFKTTSGRIKYFK